jgi:hypothetical protein
MKELNYTIGDSDYEDLNAVGHHMVPGLTKILSTYKVSSSFWKSFHFGLYFLQSE